MCMSVCVCAAGYKEPKERENIKVKRMNDTPLEVGEQTRAPLGLSIGKHNAPPEKYLKAYQTQSMPTDRPLSAAPPPPSVCK